MTNLKPQKQIPRSIEQIIQRFAEKSELLAAESYTIFKMDKEISHLIGIIIIHQATELALKALCILQEKNVFEKGHVTITFDEALQRSTKAITGHEKELLKILNVTRNNYQHSALFDISNLLDPYAILIDTISIISKVLKIVNYQPYEIDLILDHETNTVSNNENETSLEGV